MAGRPTALNSQRQATIVEALEKGHSQRDAAIMAGVSESVFYHWCTLGRQAKSGRYFQFLEAVEAANAKVADVLLHSALSAATQGATKRVVTRSTVRDDKGRPLRDDQGKLVTEVTERDEHIPPNGTLALEMLSRKRPEEWGRRQALEHSGPQTPTGPGPIEVTFVPPPERDADGNVVGGQLPAQRAESSKEGESDE